MDLKKLLMPMLITLITAFILGMSGYCWKTLADDIKENRHAIKEQCSKSEARDKELRDKKVDNATMQKAIQVMQVQQQASDKNFDRLYQEVKEIKKARGNP